MEPKWRSFLMDLRPSHKIFLQSKYDTIMDLKIFYTLNKHHENGLRIYSSVQLTSRLKWKCLVIKVCYFWLWLHGLEDVPAELAGQDERRFPGIQSNLSLIIRIRLPFIWFTAVVRSSTLLFNVLSWTCIGVTSLDKKY